MNIIGLYGKLEYLTESKLEEDVDCHDSGATLFVDGYHIRSINEERLSRVKEDGGFPRKSIDYVLGDISKDDVDLAEAFEKWTYQLSILDNMGSDYKLSSPWMTALKIPMSNQVDKLDFITEKAKSSIDEDTPTDQVPDTMFRIILSKVREFLSDKRLESNFKENSDDMEIGGVEGKHDDDADTIPHLSEVQRLALVLEASPPGFQF